MKSWMEERDLFIAQTMAFVEEIAASMAVAVVPQIVAVPIDQLQNAEQPRSVDAKRTDAPAEPSAAPRPLSSIDERAEIQKRVASFRAHQVRLIQDRDQFFHSVMTKIGDTMRSKANPTDM